MERRLVLAAAALAALLVIVQAAMQLPAVRGLLSGTERAEGERYRVESTP